MNFINPYLYNINSVISPFTFIIDTNNISSGSTNTQMFALPLDPTSSINSIVDWGDGTINTVTSYSDPNATHTYLVAGIYEIKITGFIDKWRFNDKDDKSKITSISKWGSFIINIDSGFYGCDKLTIITATDHPLIQGAQSMVKIFKDCILLTSIDVSNFDISSITNLKQSFHKCKKLTILDVSSWNVANVSSGYKTFANCYLLPIIDVSSWSTISLTTCYQMFLNTIANPDVENWDTSLISNFNSMLKNADNFDRSLHYWDITSGTDFNNFMSFATGISTQRYNSTLKEWSLQSPNINQSVNFGGSTYSIVVGTFWRDILINTYGWTIIDGGGV